MKTPKPGQFCTINKVIFRAKRRTSGCTGCALDSLLSCPNIGDSKNKIKPLACAENGIILIRV